MSMSVLLLIRLDLFLLFIVLAENRRFLSLSLSLSRSVLTILYSFIRSFPMTALIRSFFDEEKKKEEGERKVF